MINLWLLFYRAGIYFTPVEVLDYIRKRTEDAA